MGRIIQRVTIEENNDGEQSNYGQFIDKAHNEFYWPRILHWTTSQGTFTSPSRIITSQALSAQARLGMHLSNSAEIGLIDRGGLNSQRITGLLSTKSSAQRYILEVSKHRRRLTNQALKILYIYPTRSDTYSKKTKIRNDSGRRLLNNNESLSIRFFELIKEIYTKSQSQTLAIPTLSGNFNIQRKIISSGIRALELGDVAEVIPTIDMTLHPIVIDNTLKFIIENYVETDIVKAIALHNSFSNNSSASRAILSQTLVDKHILSLIFSVNRTDQDSEVSGIHRQSTRFGDAFASRFVRYLPPDDSQEDDLDEEPYEPKFFNTSKRNIIQILGNGSDNDSYRLNNELSTAFPKDKYLLNSVIQNFLDNPEDENALQDVSALSKLHEQVFSEKEFAYLKLKLKNGKLAEYRQERPELYFVNT